VRLNTSGVTTGLQLRPTKPASEVHVHIPISQHPRRCETYSTPRLTSKCLWFKGARCLHDVCAPLLQAIVDGKGRSMQEVTNDLHATRVPVPVPVIRKVQNRSLYRRSVVQQRLSCTFRYQMKAAIKEVLGISCAKSFPHRLQLPLKTITKQRSQCQSPRDAARRRCNAIFLALFCSSVASMPSESPYRPKQEQD
jgi:hypothetical protein